jgi:hypothetical protein
VSEPIPIPIPIREVDPPTAADAPVGDDVAMAETLAEILTALVVVGADLVREVATERGVPEGGASERLLQASAGLAIDAIRTMGALLAAVERSASDLAATSSAGRSVAAHGRSTWERTRAAEDDAATDALRATVEAIIDRLDLTSLVREHVDLDAVVDDLDLDPIVARVDADALLDRIDMERLAARIDVNALVERLNVAAVIDRLDLTALASAVIEELDLSELIRQASAETTSDEVRLLRLRGVGADGAVQRAVDRVLRRRTDR